MTNSFSTTLVLAGIVAATACAHDPIQNDGASPSPVAESRIQEVVLPADAGMHVADQGPDAFGIEREDCGPGRDQVLSEYDAPRPSVWVGAKFDILKDRDVQPARPFYFFRYSCR